MPIKDELLSILCCPKSKIPVKQLNSSQLAIINQEIGLGNVKYVDGDIVKDLLTDGLITTDHQTIYRIDDDIPIMLIEQGISVSQIKSLFE